MSGIFDRLQKQLDIRKREGGISALELADLPPNLRQIMRLMLREVVMKYDDIVAAVDAMPESRRMSHAELDEAEELDDYRGLNQRSPWFALMMLFLMFSMAGVPPFVGFLSKLYVISAVLDIGGTGLAVLMVLASVIGAYYYLRVIWYMYFEEGEDKAVLQASLDTRLVLSLNSVAVLALGVVPGWLLAMCVAILG